MALSLARAFDTISIFACPKIYFACNLRQNSKILLPITHVMSKCFVAHRFPFCTSGMSNVSFRKPLRSNYNGHEVHFDMHVKRLTHHCSCRKSSVITTSPAALSLHLQVQQLYIHYEDAQRARLKTETMQRC